MGAQTAFDGLSRWCEEELERLRSQLIPFEAGTMHIGKRGPNGPWKDTTADEIEWIKRKIAELDELVARISEKAQAHAE